MKKFYAFAAAAMMAVSAFAQNGAPLYATGDGFPNGTWAPATPSEFVYADGQYTLEIKNLSQFKISTAFGEWTEFNGGALTCDYGKEAGKAVELVPGDANIATPWIGDYTITVAGDLSTITLSTDTPAPTGPALIYVRGEMNSWGADEAWAFTQKGENLYKFEFAEDQSIVAGESFKIADATWGAINMGGDGENPLLPDTDCEVFNGGNPANMTLTENCNGVIWVILDLDGANYFWYSNDKDAMPDWAEENMYPVATWGVIGGFNNWGGDLAMTEKEAGVWTVTMDELEGEFKFRFNGDWATNYGASGNGDITASGDYGIVANGDNFKIAKVEKVTLTLNTNTGILTVESDSLSGVAQIEENDAPAKYFNLQGVEVANPSNGIYIVVKGNKVSKTVVK